ncbi:MAG: hypothetical protein D6796_15360 [Caldilineae bacterium]|nr:MAG: hypothetical protein D6796_15360 [Caldilineae bacterium]
MNIAGAVVAGLVGTAVISMIMAMAPKMGMPKMAIWELLGSMFSAEGNTGMGWVVHFVMGVVFAILYAVLWSAGIGAATVGWGLVFGVVHWLAVGVMMGGMPMMHAGIKAGRVNAPGVFMMSNGVMGFMGGLVGHAVFGIVVALVYGLF